MGGWWMPVLAAVLLATGLWLFTSSLWRDDLPPRRQLLLAAAGYVITLSASAPMALWSDVHHWP